VQVNTDTNLTQLKAAQLALSYCPPSPTTDACCNTDPTVPVSEGHK